MYIFRFCWTSTASFACPHGKPHIYPQYILSKLNLRFYPGGSRQTRIQILILNVGVKPDKKKKGTRPQVAHVVLCLLDILALAEFGHILAVSYLTVSIMQLLCQTSQDVLKGHLQHAK